MVALLVSTSVRRVLAVVLIVVCSALLVMSLFSQQIGSTISMFGSIIREDVIGHLYPQEEKVISQGEANLTNLVITSICKRQFFFDYSVYIDVRDSSPDGSNTRHFIAEKDSIQDCNEFVINSIEVQDGGSVIKIFFGNRSNKVITVTDKQGTQSL